MKTLTGLAIASGFLCANLFAAPAITGVVNSASLIPPGLPNYGIAQGSIFNVFGSSLGPAAILGAPSLPLPLTLGGTTVTITVGGSTVTAPMFYTYQTQLAAILPSNTPVGTGTLTVSFGGATGTSPITVVQSNVGIYTDNQSGGGPGVVTLADYSVLQASHSALPNDALIIWATGLGPITGSDASAPTETDLGTAIQVFIGGVSAQVLYRGRSSFAGLDQINVLMPAGVTAGCAVSLVIQTNNLVSNTISIPVGSSGNRTCTDATSGSGTQGPTIPPGATTFSFGEVSLSSSVSSLLAGGSLIASTPSYGALAIFDKVSVTSSGTVSGLTQSTVTSGSCSTTILTVSNTPTGGFTGFSGTPLDAGTITLTPPSGPASALPSLETGIYESTPNSLAAGNYTFTGAGGAGVGGFTTTLTVPPALVWTNQSIATSAISRSKPLTVTWTGGGSGNTVQFQILSINAGPASSTDVTVACTAPASAGQLTVPTSILLGLIPTATAGNVIDIATLSVQGMQSFTATGIQYGEAIWQQQVGVDNITLQ
jgi:uncharacterized protein (TIGR03437 family)